MNRLCKSLMVLHVAAALSGLAIQARAADPPNRQSRTSIGGRQSRLQVCAACHGADGNSAGGAFPKLAGQHRRVYRQAAEGFQDAAGRESSPRATIRSWRASRPRCPNRTWSTSRPTSRRRRQARLCARQEHRRARPEDLSRRHRGQGRAGVCGLSRRQRAWAFRSQFPRLSWQWGDYTVAQLTAFTQARTRATTASRCTRSRRACRTARSRPWPITSRACIKSTVRARVQPVSRGRYKTRKG